MTAKVEHTSLVQASSAMEPVRTTVQAPSINVKRILSPESNLPTTDHPAAVTGLVPEPNLTLDNSSKSIKKRMSTSTRKKSSSRKKHGRSSSAGVISELNQEILTSKAKDTSVVKGSLAREPLITAVQKPIADSDTALSPDELVELARRDPEKAKRIIATRNSAANLKEKKEKQTSKLKEAADIYESQTAWYHAQMNMMQAEILALEADNERCRINFQNLCPECITKFSDFHGNGNLAIEALRINSCSVSSPGSSNCAVSTVEFNANSSCFPGIDNFAAEAPDVDISGSWPFQDSHGPEIFSAAEEIPSTVFQDFLSWQHQEYQILSGRQELNFEQLEAWQQVLDDVQQPDDKKILKELDDSKSQSSD